MNEYVRDSFLKHYGILGMHWGERHYQPYGYGYPLSTGREFGLAARLSGRQKYSFSDVYGKNWKSTKYKMIGEDAVRNGKTAISNLFKRAKATGQGLHARTNTYTREAKAAFDKWNTRDLGYDQTRMDALNKRTAQTYNVKQRYAEALAEAMKTRRNNALSRAHDAEALLSKIDLIKLQNQGKAPSQRYMDYATDHENSSVSALEKIADKYSSEHNLAARKASIYFQKHSPLANQTTKTGYAKERLQKAVSKAASTSKEYADALSPLLSTSVTQIGSGLKQASSQLKINANKKATDAIKQSQYFKSIDMQKRLSQMDIDKELLAFFQGKLKINPTTSTREIVKKHNLGSSLLGVKPSEEYYMRYDD